ncbi:MAG: 3-phosphoshikimate 1-carboxyvinyltransferase [Ruminococcaceae bacterium]|nr:3-phosphoshikimate 1-carboxyvinyltransferase [Oscillospiraceae bacterium]
MDIRITPTKLSGEIRAISSKSDVHRLLIASALAKGETKITFTTLSDDIKATMDVLCTMGAKIELSGNDGAYTATVCGIEEMPRGVTLDANECGTTARLILPIAAALCDSFTLTGKNGLKKRPFAGLCGCMEQNGTACSDTFLPITTSGKLKSGTYKIRGDISSQYISALLFALPLLDGDSEIVINNQISSIGYIAMTFRTLTLFGIIFERTNNGFLIKGNQQYRSCGAYTAEGDWSNAAFWLCGGAMGGDITVTGLDITSFQPDCMLLNILNRVCARIANEENGGINTKKSILRNAALDGDSHPDLIPIVATMLSLSIGDSRIYNAKRLRIKESDRIATTTAMLKALGADIKATDDGFLIWGVDRFIGGEVDAANDHRIAMCAAIASQCAVGDVIIRGAECVNKSYPTFFEDFKKLGGKFDVING